MQFFCSGTLRAHMELYKPLLRVIEIIQKTVCKTISVFGPGKRSHQKTKLERIPSCKARKPNHYKHTCAKTNNNMQAHKCNQKQMLIPQTYKNDPQKTEPSD
ncbi:hypothetical protein OTU49_007338 [Cherax quadricarinatus]|uniref:Uncharacterized protein n=1 Tax=Cherax quadricarinatus TaxID=27406 RepID=A0AAW0WWT7_CHEQU